jgi:hypothetical protein
MDKPTAYELRYYIEMEMYAHNKALHEKFRNKEITYEFLKTDSFPLGFDRVISAGVEKAYKNAAKEESNAA